MSISALIWNWPMAVQIGNNPYYNNSQLKGQPACATRVSAVLWSHSCPGVIDWL